MNNQMNLMKQPYSERLETAAHKPENQDTERNKVEASLTMMKYSKIFAGSFNEHHLTIYLNFAEEDVTLGLFTWGDFKLGIRMAFKSATFFPKYGEITEIIENHITRPRRNAQLQEKAELELKKLKYEEANNAQLQAKRQYERDQLYKIKTPQEAAKRNKVNEMIKTFLGNLTGQSTRKGEPNERC